MQLMSLKIHIPAGTNYCFIIHLWT